jgi:hypothetical protein
MPTPVPEPPMRLPSAQTPTAHSATDPSPRHPVEIALTRRGFAPIQVNLTECLLSDIAETAASFAYRPSRFHNAIYFHLADLDLYPDSLKSTHTNALTTIFPNREILRTEPGAAIHTEPRWPKASDASDCVAVKARKRSDSSATARFRNAKLGQKIRTGRREGF